MKIALISQNAYPALPIFRKNLILDLVALGHEVYCLANDYTDQTKQQVSQLGAQPVPYKLSRSGLNPFIDFLNTIKLYKLLKELNLDVMLSFFCQTSYIWKYCFQACKSTCTCWYAGRFRLCFYRTTI